MKSNKFATGSKINTHSLKAQNFRFLANSNDEFQNIEIVDYPMDYILSFGDKHEGIHYLTYVLDDEEINNKVVISQEELDSVVTQLRIELGGTPVELVGVVNE